MIRILFDIGMYIALYISMIYVPAILVITLFILLYISITGNGKIYAHSINEAIIGKNRTALLIWESLSSGFMRVLQVTVIVLTFSMMYNNMPYSPDNVLLWAIGSDMFIYGMIAFLVIVIVNNFLLWYRLRDFRKELRKVTDRLTQVN